MEINKCKSDFSGVKVALIYKDLILTILRDNIETIPYPNMWDLSGGGREEKETPFECAKREIFEELNIFIDKKSILWMKKYQGIVNSEKESFFMVIKIKKNDIDNIKFGNEGQKYKFMKIDEFLRDKNVIECLKLRLKDYLRSESILG